MKKHYKIFLVIIACLFSCEREKDPVVINSFEPTSGDYNTEVIIKGSQFTPSNTQVLFGNVSAKIISMSPAEIIATVPVGATTGKINVQSGGQQARSAGDFTVTSGTWTKKSNFTNLPINQPHDLFFSVGNKAYVHVSSRVRNGIDENAELWEYNSSSDSWAKKKELDLDQGPVGATAFGTSDKGYILQYQKLWEYDPTNNQWTKKNALPVALNSDTVIDAFYASSSNIVIVVLFNGDWFTYNPVSDAWGRNLSAPFASTFAISRADGFYQPHNHKRFCSAAEDHSQSV